MWVLVLSVVGVVLCAELVIGVVLHMRASQKAKKAVVAQLLDQTRIPGPERGREPAADRPRPVPGPTAGKQ